MLPEPVIPVGMQEEKKEGEDDSLLGAATKHNPLNIFEDKTDKPAANAVGGANGSSTAAAGHSKLNSSEKK